MNSIQQFMNENLGKITVVIIDGMPWFVGKDVCNALGYVNSKDAIRKHVDAEDRQVLQRSQFATLEGVPNRGLTVINESGMYQLVFCSAMPNAKAFKRWVTSEVLTSIRQYGGYLDGQERMTDAERQMIFNQMKQLQGMCRKLQEQNEVLTEKADVLSQMLRDRADAECDYFEERADEREMLLERIYSGELEHLL